MERTRETDMEDKKQPQPRCESVCGDDRCERELGHHGKHINFATGYITWTTAGAATLNEELAELAAQQKQK